MSRRLTNSSLLAISSIILAVVGVVYFCLELLCFRGPSKQEILSQYKGKAEFVTVELGETATIKLSSGREIRVYKLESINQWVMPWSSFQWNDNESRLVFINTVAYEPLPDSSQATAPILRFDGIKVKSEDIPDDILEALEQANRYPSH